MISQKKEKHIKLLGPSNSNEEYKLVKQVLSSGWWGKGPVTETLEKEFAQFVGAKYAVAVNGATSGLHLALKVLDKKGKVIVPAFTFVSTAVVALYEGCEVVFADIDEKTFCLDPIDVARKIDKNTIAIIPVHYGGNVADMNYSNSNIPIIEDCAHGAGAPIGKNGFLSVWSFHPVKNIATGDGGMITTNNKELAERLKKLAWMGIDQSTYDRNQKKYSWNYDISEIGYKYHANDILSAVALAQLRRIKTLNKKRKLIAQKYLSELKNLPLILPHESKSWHLFVIRVDKKYRNKLIDYLATKNIAAGVHYRPLYYYKIFNWNIKDIGKSLPNTEKIWQEVISLPMYPDLTEKDQSNVIKEITRFFK